MRTSFAKSKPMSLSQLPADWFHSGVEGVITHPILTSPGASIQFFKHGVLLDPYPATKYQIRGLEVFGY